MVGDSTHIPDFPLDALFDDAGLFLRAIDFENRVALFTRMTRDDYVRSSFLDERLTTRTKRPAAVPLAAVRNAVAQHCPEPPRINYIFHTAFGGSTVLSRSLDLPGVCLAYKEPFALHQLACLRRQDPRPEAASLPTPLLRESIALLGRVMQPGEVPVIKPTDSCLNIAAELLLAQPQSAGLFLYSKLDSFLIAMLKDDERRQYARGMVERAHLDIGSDPRFAGVNRTDLTDAQAAAFVWIGLMEPALELLADDRLQLRTLEAAELIGRPADVLAATVDLFGLAHHANDIETAIQSTFHRDAKAPALTFDQGAYAEEQRAIARALEPEIRAGIDWVMAYTRGRTIPDRLPKPLLGPAPQ